MVNVSILYLSILSQGEHLDLFIISGYFQSSTRVPCIIEEDKLSIVILGGDDVL